MAMKTTQGWAWLTAGVLALGLNGFYHDGGAAWAHRIVDRIASQSETLVNLASAHGDRFTERANFVVARNETVSCRLATAIARVQTKIARTQGGVARFEAMSARQQAAWARVEANRARIEAQVGRLRLDPVAFSSVTGPVVVCPRVRVNVPRVVVPKLPVIDIPTPVVHVDLPGNGPV